MSSGDYKSDTNRRRDQMQISLLIVDSPVTFLFSTVLTQSVCARIYLFERKIEVRGTDADQLDLMS